MLFMPMTGSNLNIGEPNDHCIEAVPMATNRQYRFFADNANDWYQFDLPGSTPVVVRLTDYHVEGQIIIWSGSDCSNLTFIRSNGDDQPTKVLNLGTRPAGRYFIWIINDNAPTYIPYHLTVETN
jgi:hypothetical protein